MNEWKEYKLVDLTKKIGSGATPTGGSSAYHSIGISLIRSQNVLDLKFSNDGLAFIDNSQADELKNVTVEENDILLNITGDSVARVCKVPKRILPARVNQHVSIIRADKKKLNSDFLLYKLQAIKEYLLSISEIGGTRRALTKSLIENLVLIIPELPEQNSIASILSSLDDKIDLLHRQNNTLEQLAETLFRQWFIEETEDSWGKTNIGKVLHTELGGTPSTTNPEYWDGDVPWINSGEINKFRIVEPTRFITKLGLAKSNTKIMPVGTTVLAITGATLGQVSLLEIETCANQSVIGIIPNETFPKEFVFLWIKYKIEDIILNETGGAQPHINKNDINETEIIIPPQSLLKEKNLILSTYFSKITANTFQIRTLTQLRDTLLPKLMSGDVRVK